MENTDSIKWHKINPDGTTDAEVSYHKREILVITVRNIGVGVIRYF